MAGASVRSMRVRPLGLLSLAGLILTGPMARAEPVGASTDRERPVEPSEMPALRGLVVIVNAEQGHLDPYRVRRAVEDELGVLVLSAPDERAAGTLTVLVRGESELEMTYAGKDGRRNSRALELPTDPDKRLETVALVAGNLVRDETGQLIEELRPPPASNATPAEQSPNAEAPPVPAPQKPEAENAAKKQAPPQKPKPEAKEKPKETAEDSSPNAAEAPLIDTPLNLSLFHPLALHRDSERRRFGLEVGFAYSRVGAIGGVGVTVFVNRIDRSLSGVQVGSIGTLVGGDADGVILAGIFSHQGGDGAGAVASGAFSYASGSYRGARVAGVGGWLGGSLTGFQAAGVVNVTGPVSGVTVGGTTNVARGSVAGGQISGIVNVAKDVDGFQIGLVNVGQRVRGLQIGLVNVADEVDGASIALVPVVADGHQRLVFWSAPGHALANVGAKFENGPIYSLVGIGYQPEPGVGDVGRRSGKYYPTAAVGAHANLGPGFIEVDVQYQSAQRIEDGSGEHQSLAIRPKLGWQPLERFGVFAGLAAERRITREENLNLRGFAGFQVF